MQIKCGKTTFGFQYTLFYDISSIGHHLISDATERGLSDQIGSLSTATRLTRRPAWSYWHIATSDSTNKETRITTWTLCQCRLDYRLIWPYWHIATLTSMNQDASMAIRLPHDIYVSRCIWNYFIHYLSMMMVINKWPHFVCWSREGRVSWQSRKIHFIFYSNIHEKEIFTKTNA